MPRVLVVEDDAAMCELIVEELADHGFTAEGVGDAASAAARLEAGGVDVLITDLNLARNSGLSVCRHAHAVEPELPVIIITAFGSMEAAIEAIRAGAYDFITKPFPMETLVLAVERADRLRRLEEELAELRVRVRKSGRRSRIDGTSGVISRLREHVATVAATDATVVITGESGSGKEGVARELHELSRRADGPFVAENLAAIPSELAESTLFGHVRGAFTGATSSRDGLFRAANGGTLLLDEIAELPLELQPKLLRVLEEGRVRPVGCDRSVEVDVRVVVATHVDLEAAVSRGEFREDLFYRLAVIELQVPPLRDRGADILLLAQLFLEEHARKLERDVQGLHPETAARLLGWTWPGNVRELRNAMQRAVVLAKHRLIHPTDLPPRLRDVEPVAIVPTRDEEPLLPLAEVERRHVLRALRELGGNKAEAARVLGIGRKTLYRKLDAWGLDLSHPDTADGD